MNQDFMGNQTAVTYHKRALQEITLVTINLDGFTLVANKMGKFELPHLNEEL